MMQLGDIITPVYTEHKQSVVNSKKRFSVEHNDKVGRHIVAQQFIPKNTTILQEQPTIWTLTLEQFSNYCASCTCPIEQPVKQQSDDDNNTPKDKLFFCSEKCQIENDEYIKIEKRITEIVSYQDLAALTGIAYDLIRLTIKVLILKYQQHLLSSINKSDQMTINTNPDNTVDNTGDSNKPESVSNIEVIQRANVFDLNNLTVHANHQCDNNIIYWIDFIKQQNKQQGEDIEPVDVGDIAHAVVVFAQKVYPALKKLDRFFELMYGNNNNSNDDIKNNNNNVENKVDNDNNNNNNNQQSIDIKLWENLALDILHTTGRLNANSHILRLPPSLEVIGMGIFAQGSQFNHSCMANCIFENSGTTLKITTLCDVFPGEELSVPYIELNQNYLSRHAELLETKSFWCDCLRCQGILKIANPTQIPSSQLSQVLYDRLVANSARVDAIEQLLSHLNLVPYFQEDFITPSATTTTTTQEDMPPTNNTSKHNNNPNNNIHTPPKGAKIYKSIDEITTPQFYEDYGVMMKYLQTIPAQRNYINPMLTTLQLSEKASQINEIINKFAANIQAQIKNIENQNESPSSNDDNNNNKNTNIVEILKTTDITSLFKELNELYPKGLIFPQPASSSTKPPGTTNSDFQLLDEPLDLYTYTALSQVAWNSTRVQDNNDNNNTTLTTPKTRTAYALILLQHAISDMRVDIWQLYSEAISTKRVFSPPLIFTMALYFSVIYHFYPVGAVLSKQLEFSVIFSKIAAVAGHIPDLPPLPTITTKANNNNTQQQQQQATAPTKPTKPATPATQTPLTKEQQKQQALANLKAGKKPTIPKKTTPMNNVSPAKAKILQNLHNIEQYTKVILPIYELLYHTTTFSFGENKSKISARIDTVKWIEARLQTAVEYLNTAIPYYETELDKQATAKQSLTLIATLNSRYKKVIAQIQEDLV